MEINKSQKRLLILLGVVLLYFVYDIISNYDTYASFYTGKKKPVVAKKVEKQTAKKIAAEEESNQLYLENWGRDPFYMKVENKAKAKVKRRQRKVHFKLHAISMKSNGSVALINDKIVKIGDIISGYTLTKIDKKQVTLTNGAKKITLKLDTY